MINAVAKRKHKSIREKGTGEAEVVSILLKCIYLFERCTERESERKERQRYREMQR